MKNIKYLFLSAILIGFTACNDEEDFEEFLDNPTEEVVYPALSAGSVDFSKYISLGNSLTSGFTDGALFVAAQENSMPNTLSKKFALAGGGAFTQPLMSDNVGGLLLGGSPVLHPVTGANLFAPRLYFDGAGPAVLQGMSTTDFLLNNPTGPFNNLGVPGALSFHLLAPGYGNIANFPVAANPYAVRIAGNTDASILELAMAQSATFFSLWIGNNDVLGYATSGGDGSSPITNQVTFDLAINTLVSTLTSNGAKGVMANIPYVTTIPHFTTVPYNAIPLNAATAAAVNSAYAAYNAGIQGLVGVPPVMLTQEEADSRMINFTAGQNAIVIMDEGLSDMTVYSPALISMRQATPDDLFVLPSSNFIGTEAVPGDPTTVNGVAIPLADKWVLVPSEQDEIKAATDAFNATIQNAASAAGLAFVDANALMQQLDAGGFADGDFILTSSLVTGGAFSLDGVHPTARGYALLANQFMKAIDATYGSNFEASGNLVDIGNYPTNYSPMLQ